MWYGSIAESKFKDEGDGFKEGDIVTIEVDLENGKIKWIVNDKQKAEIETDILKDIKRKFVPFADFYNKGDTIEWLETE